MTIKTSGGKVITKGGKVSCSCCEDPDCCMYPAAGLGVDYTEADLPDAVDVDGESKSRSGTSYGNTTNGVILEGIKWAVYRSGSRSTQNCLIAGVVEDQFADDLIVTSAAVRGSPVTITRQSLCVWSGLDGCGNPVYIWHCSNGGSGATECNNDSKWMAAYQGYFFDPPDCTREEFPAGLKLGNQHGPLGTYEIGGTPIITVTEA